MPLFYDGSTIEGRVSLDLAKKLNIHQIAVKVSASDPVAIRERTNGLYHVGSRPSKLDIPGLRAPHSSHFRAYISQAYNNCLAPIYFCYIAILVFISFVSSRTIGRISIMAV